MIILTEHARDRMRERGILRQDIKRIIVNPDKIQRENNRIIISGKINKEKLEIVYVIENNKRIILTCYYL